MASSTTSRLPGAASAFTRKKRDTPSTANTQAPNPGPQINYDLESTVNAAANNESSNGRLMPIDVLPDTRFPLIGIMYNISTNFHAYSIRGYPQASAPSLVAYCLYLLFGYLLVNDVFVRHEPTPWAQALVNDFNFQQFLELFANLYVPVFMVDIFTGLASHSDERRPGLEFVASLAGFSLYHDFGRMMSPYAFIAAHNLLSRLPGNTSPVIATEMWYRLGLLYDANGTTYRIGQLFGSMYDDATTNTTFSYTSWLSNRVNQFMNMATARYNQQRPVLSVIPLTAIEWDLLNQNPYAAYLGLGRASNGPANFGFITSFLTELSSFTKEQVGSTLTMSDMLKIVSDKITVHTIFGPILPTWHSLPLAESRPTYNPSTGSGSTSTPYTLKELSVSQFAKNTKFLAPRDTTGRNVVKLKYPDDTNKISPKLYLVDNSNKDSPITYVLFNPSIHLTPPPWIFDPHDTVAQRNYFALISGLMIESSEIDGIGIPLPDPASVDLHTENSWFQQGLIPLDQILRGMLDEFSGIPARTHTIYRRDKIAFALRNMAKNLLPAFAQSVFSDETSVDPANLGFTVTPGIDDTRHASTWFGRLAQENLDRKKNTLYLWSSYRVVEREKSPTWTTTGANRNPDTIVSMFPTLRHLYGLNVTLRSSPFLTTLVP